MERYDFFGDSHIRQFFLDFPGDVSINWFSGATAQGLNNENSRSRAGQKIKMYINLFQPKQEIMMFGGVDLDFTLYKKLNEDIDLNIDEYIKMCVDRYRDYIKTISNKIELLQILGVHLPTTLDSHVDKSVSWSANITSDEMKEIALKRSIDHKKRIYYAQQFNDQLEIACSSLDNVQFHRIDNFMLNAQGDIDEKFIVNPWEHHARKSETVKLWAPLLNLKWATQD